MTGKDTKVKQSAAPPRAVVPPRLRPLATRPVAAASVQRRRRRAANRKAGSITAVVRNGEAELLLFGTIGVDYWSDEGITAKSFDAELKSLGDVSRIRLRINSGGGDVFEATAIYNMLVKHEAEIAVEVEGVAASAATLIAMAGDTIAISENAHWMIHRASGMAWGNADELRQYLTLLDNADGLIRLTYARRTGLSDSDLVDLMDHDNWMTAGEAVELGFADSVDAAKTVKPHIAPDSVEDALTQRVLLDSRKLAAWAGNLETMSASSLPAATTGGSQDTNRKGQDMSKTTNTQAAAAAPPSPEQVLTTLLDERDKKQAEAAKAWKKEVDANLALAFPKDVPQTLRDECLEMRDDGIDAVRTKIADYRRTTNSETGVVHLSDSQPRDRHLAALKAGVQVRALAGSADKHLPAKDRPQGTQDFIRVPLIKIAEQCLLLDGFSHDQIGRLSPAQVAMAAMGFHRNAGIRADAGLHTTGTLLEITRDAINKSLAAGYEEAPQTWRGPMRQGASVADFKNIHRVKISAVGNLPGWTDGQAPELAKLANEKETYAVEAKASTLSFSWRLFVNDDMDALSRGPQLLGNAAARTVNAVAWAQITSNPTMSDGQALFLETPAGNRKRKNFTTGTGAPSNTTIGALRTLMRLMRGLNTPEGNESSDVLNLMPAYIVGPAALEDVILKQVLSLADPAASGNAAVFNSARQLTPVIEPLLDAASSVAWYLFASPSQIDTVEVTFLQGQETPVTHEWMDDATMSQNVTIVQTFAAKALDHRGVQKHKGEA